MFRRKPKEEDLKPPATLPATFAEAWEIARTKHLQKNPVEPAVVVIDVVKPIVDWVEKLQPEERGFGKADVYTEALLLGAFFLVAGHRGETPFLVTPNRRKAEVTFMSEFQPYEENEDNSTYRITVDPTVSAVRSWVHFDGGTAAWEQEGGGGPTISEIVHSGVHILGAMTLLPERTALVVVPQHDEGESRFCQPDINVAGAPPFPHDLAVATLPFIPPQR